jgi:hypothetical protein
MLPAQIGPDPKPPFSYLKLSKKKIIPHLLGCLETEIKTKFK